MKAWAPHIAARALGAHPRGNIMHSRLLTQTIQCISRTVIGEPGHSLLQDSIPDDEELECVPSKRKLLNWTPLAWLNSLSHHTGFSTSEGFNKEKMIQDWTAWNCQQLGLPISHLQTFRHDACTCKRFTIDQFGDHLHCCTQHAGATMGAHGHLLTAVPRLLTMAGYKPDRKHVPHSRGLREREMMLFIGTQFSVTCTPKCIRQPRPRKGRPHCQGLLVGRHSGPHHRRVLASRVPRLMPQPHAQRGSITRRRQRRARCRSQSEARQLPARLQRAQLFLPSRHHDDLQENQWRFPPSAIHTVRPPSRQL